MRKTFLFKILKIRFFKKKTKFKLVEPQQSAIQQRFTNPKPHTKCTWRKLPEHVKFRRQQLPDNRRPFEQHSRMGRQQRPSEINMYA